MSDLKKAAQQGLRALKTFRLSLLHPDSLALADAAVAALETALEQPEQEPVAWIQPDHLQKARQAPFLCRVEPTQRCADFVPFYTHPPRREWVSLTEEEIRRMGIETPGQQGGWNLAFARAIEAALKERNT